MALTLAEIKSLAHEEDAASIVVYYDARKNGNIKGFRFKFRDSGYKLVDYDTGEVLSMYSGESLHNGNARMVRAGATYFEAYGFYNERKRDWYVTNKGRVAA